MFPIHQICVWHPLGSRYWTIYLGFDYVVPKLKEVTEYADRRETTSLGTLHVSVETAGMHITLGTRVGTQRQDLAPPCRGDLRAWEEEKILAAGV